MPRREGDYRKDQPRAAEHPGVLLSWASNVGEMPNAG